MQRLRINKQDSQSVFDVLLQYSGAISGLFDFLNGNGLHELEFPEGEYFSPAVLNDGIANRLNPEGLLIPVIGSNGGISPFSINVEVNDQPFNIWGAASIQNIILIDTNNQQLPAILNHNEIIVDLEMHYKFLEQQIIKDEFEASPGASVKVEIDDPYSHSIDNNAMGNTPENITSPGNDNDITVEVNDAPFNIWTVGSSHNIIVKDTNDNELDVILNGNRIIVKGIKVSIKINGIIQQMVTIPLTKPTAINLK